MSEAREAGGASEATPSSPADLSWFNAAEYLPDEARLVWGDWPDARDYLAAVRYGDRWASPWGADHPGPPTMWRYDADSRLREEGGGPSGDVG